MPQTSRPSPVDLRQARGLALKQVRKASGLSARKLVERVNARTSGSDITEHAIYAYESGRVQLSREVAERVAEVLRVPLAGLLVGDPDFHPPAANASPAETAGGTQPPVTPAGGPPEAGRWSATRTSLLARCAEAEPAAAVLGRQLAVRRFQLPDPRIFAASFELLDADLSALVDSPEAAWLGCREDDEWHAPLKELLQEAEALRAAAKLAWDRLGAAAASGGAADACPAAVETLEAALTRFRDAIGEVRKRVAGG